MVATSSDSASLLSKYPALRTVVSPTPVLLPSTKGALRRFASLGAIETSIIVPGAFPGGTNHFAHSGTPADKERAAEYEAGPYKGYGKRIQEAFAAIVPPDADAGAVAAAIVRIGNTPFG